MATYEVGRNEKRTLSSRADLLVVGQLILREASILEVPSGNLRLTIIAKETLAARDSSIFARGADGEPGASATNAGHAGSDGKDGQSGATLRLYLGRLDSQGLQVITEGGAGGNGGAGARGSQGSEASCVGSGAGAAATVGEGGLAETEAMEDPFSLP